MAEPGLARYDAWGLGDCIGAFGRVVGLVTLPPEADEGCFSCRLKVVWFLRIMPLVFAHAVCPSYCWFPLSRHALLLPPGSFRGPRPGCPG